MRRNIVEAYFPLKKYVGDGQVLRAASLVQKKNFLPLGTYVKENSKIGVILQGVDPLSNAYNVLLCTLIEEGGQLVDPASQTSGHFSLLDLVPLLDEEIKDLECRLAAAGYK